LDMLRFQTDEIDAAALQDGEEEQLVARRDLLHNAEKIARLLTSARMIMDGDEGESGALSAVEQTASLLKEAGRLFPTSQELSVRLLAVLPELQDIAASVAEACDSPDFDPAELDAVEERLALVRKLCSKYGGTVSAVLAFAQKAHEELRAIELSDDEINRLSAQLETEQQQLVEAATALTDARLKAAELFSRAVCEQLAFLDMPRVKLAVSVEKAPMTVTGADKVEFLISANPGEPPKSIAKIASGGELSRVMLALKSVMTSADEIPTLIFDEIDAGISGSAAAKVGYKLRNIASCDEKQVLCVTHLAQIAACAHQQLLIEKTVRDDRTFTDVRTVNGEERAREIARIIGGQVTPLSLQTAAEMLRDMPLAADAVKTTSL
ncbi:MAG: DNA repair protein RecN, partial [Clostridia bacterium]|nr:DNA repair protein RecN [Clostridia bacterium]